MHFSTFSAGFALLTCRFDSLLWKIIPVLLDSGNKVEFFRLTQTSFFVRRKNSTLFPSSSKSGIIFHSALSNLQVRNAKRTEKVEKCISLELLFFLTERKYSLTLNSQESTILLGIYLRVPKAIHKSKVSTWSLTTIMWAVFSWLRYGIFFKVLLDEIILQQHLISSCELLLHLTYLSPPNVWLLPKWLDKIIYDR